jgi:hypothetical protein
MSFSQKNIFQSVLGVVLLTASVYAISADGVSTFASFYHQGPWVNWLWGGLAAAVVGILVFISWPILGPVTISTIGAIGTSIGGLMGLSGIAATNAGLALLGGGAIASGGFGIIGGTALLAAALTFSTEVTLDYAIGTAMSKYEASKFAEASLKMMTLPLPVNTSGPDSVRAAGKAMESTTVRDTWECTRKYPGSVDELKQCMAAKQKTQRQLVRDALAAMDANRKPLSGPDAERENAMYALLHYLNNNYSEAKRYAFKAYAQGVKSAGTPTLPAYIYAASLLYDEVPNLKELNAKFEYSLTAEPNNPLTPVMYSALLDRLSYRLNDGAVGVDTLDRISKLAEILPDDIRRLAIQQTLLAHVLMQIKLSQQRVISLTGSQNKTIRENPRTLEVVKGSLQDHAKLLKTSSSLLARQDSLIEHITRDKPWWEDVKDGHNPFKSVKEMLDAQGWPGTLKRFRVAWTDYQQSQNYLEDRAARYEKELMESKPASPAPESTEKESWSLIKWLKGLFK